MRIALVYYSGTGNTEAMANVIAEELSGKADVDTIDPAAFGPGDIATYDAFAFGCPAMGAEVLEEDIFEPMFASIEGCLSGKKIILFGSYGWGDGEWMRSWQDDVNSAGASLVKDGLIANLTPDDSIVNECVGLGEALMKA